jgi:hypothetical protein
MPIADDPVKRSAPLTHGGQSKKGGRLGPRLLGMPQSGGAVGGIATRKTYISLLLRFRTSAQNFAEAIAVEKFMDET